MENAPETLLELQEQAQKELHEAFDDMFSPEGSETKEVENPSEANEEDLELDDPESIAEEPSSTELNIDSGQEEIVPDKPKRGRPSKNSNIEAEYTKYKQDSEAHIGLLKSRIDQLSTQYQDLKIQATKKEETPIQYPDRVKEAFELFPDLQEAINFIVENKVGKIQETIKPIQEFTAQQAKHNVMQSIYAAHPDVEQIVHSGDLNVWANSLPVVQRNGAFMIINHGSPEEVIELLNQYKESKGRHNDTSNSKTPVLQRTTSNQNFEGTTSTYGSSGTSNSSNSTSGTRGSNGNSDPIVDKVLAALNVPSNKEPVNISTNPSGKEKGFDDAVAEYENIRKLRGGW